MNALILLGLLGSERMLAANHMGLLIVALRKRWRSEVFYPPLSPPPPSFLSFFVLREGQLTSLVLTDSRWVCYSIKVFSVFGLRLTVRAPEYFLCSSAIVLI